MKNKLTLKTPASWWGANWREGLPCGNGPIGAAVYGSVHDETVLLTHEKLWHQVDTQPLPDVSQHVPQVRQLLAEGNAKASAHILADAFQEAGYQPDIGVPLPLADLKINMPIDKGFRNYRRSLDMETGEATVTWDDNGVSYRRRLFVSRSDDLIVMEATSSGGNLEMEIALQIHDLAERQRKTDKQKHVPDDVDVRIDPTGWIWFAARNDDGTDYGAVARVLQDDDSDPHGDADFQPISSPRDHHVAGGPHAPVDRQSIHVENARRVLVVVKLFVRRDRQPAWDELTGQLADVTPDYEQLLAPHVALHGELFGRVKIDLGGSDADHALSNEELLLNAYQGESCIAMVEKMWAFGRYLLISSSRPDGYPCHLLGNWCGEYRGFWAFNMANENLQMIYWQAMSGQMAEVSLPVFRYYDGMMDDFRENAMKIYGCRGIYIPAVTTPPSGLLKTLRPHIIHWTGAAAWIGQHYYDYFLYTGDREFLANRAMPFLREVALFYEDFFTIEDGLYVSSPSNSPENSPGNYWDGEGMGEAMETTINATMDFALAKEVLTHLIEGATLLGTDAADIEKWHAMRERIPPYQINEDGAVKEWMHPYFTDNYRHRHQSHIYPVFPGTEVTRSTDPELFAAFETAIDRRHVIGLGEQTGWSLAHMANVYARMDEGDQALECLNQLARSCVMNNFYTTHNDWRGMGIGVEMEWAPFQIDANMGWSAAIQEMMLFSLPGRVSVLPALPGEWAKGSFSGLVARGGVQVSATWDEAKVDIELIAPSDQKVELKVLGDTIDDIRLTAGTPYRYTHDRNRSGDPIPASV